MIAIAVILLGCLIGSEVMIAIARRQLMRDLVRGWELQDRAIEAVERSNIRSHPLSTAYLAGSTIVYEVE